MDILICLPLELQYVVLKLWFVDRCNTDNWKEYLSAGIPLNWFRYADLDWRKISAKPLFKEFIIQFEDLLDWNVLGINSRLSEDLMRKHANEIDWKYISMGQMSVSFLREFKSKILWSRFPYYSCSSETMQLLISEFGEWIDWTSLLQVRTEISIDDKFISLRIEHINFTSILNVDTRKKITDNCILTYQDHIEFQHLNRELSDFLVAQLSDKIDWDKYSKICKSDYIIQKFSERINWGHWSNARRTKTEIEKYKDRLSWCELCKIHPITENFIETYDKYLDWQSISMNFSMTETLLVKYFYKLDSKVLSKNFHHLNSNHNYSLRFLLEYIPKMDPTDFDRLQCFPEAIYTEFIFIWSTDQWNGISSNPRLTVDFIRRYQSQLNWHRISKYCTPTDAFIREFELKIYWPEMMENSNLPISIKNKFLGRLQKLGRIK